MIAESKVDQKKKENRLAALVALAAEKKSGVSSCLTEEEMVVLVAGRCSGKEKERGWAHLADCPQCYEQWYSFKMEESAANKKSGIVYLLRPRNFALIGSALAVAASVAVFLNVFQAPFSDYRIKDSEQSQQIITEEKEISFSQVKEIDEAADKALSLRKVPSVMYEKREMELKNGRVATKKMRTKTATAPQPADKVSGMADMVMAERAVAPEEKVESIDSWLEMVQEGCLKGQTEEKFWSEIILAGEQLFQDTEPWTEKNEKEARAFAVLQLMPGSYEIDSITKQCEQILVELAEGEKSR